MKLIPLTQGKFAKVDDADYEFLMQWRWHASKNAKYDKWYARRSFRVRNGPGKGKTVKVYMHQLLAASFHKDCEVDHINGDTLDDRKFNLRICTHAENTYNAKGHQDSSSKFKGVSWCKNKKMWKAALRKNKVEYLREYFNSEQEAAEAYNQKAIEIMGMFARTNVINDSEHFPMISNL